MNRLGLGAGITLVLLGAVLVRAEDTNSAPASTNLTVETPKTKEQLAQEENARRQREILQKQEEQLNKYWSSLPFNEKRAALNWYRLLTSLPPAEQQSIGERAQRYQMMTPEERSQLMRNHEQWAKMSPQERERARLEYLRLRYEYEMKWRKENPNKPPPPFRLTPPQPLATNTNVPPAPAK